MAQPPGTRPLGEADLRDELGLDPVHAARPKEARWRQPPGPRPPGEPALRDELGLAPVHAALLDRRGVLERRVLAWERAQPLADLAQRLVVEAGADLARVVQPPAGEMA